jgi:hypothetical protein
MSTPDLELATTFALDARGRIVSTLEPFPTRGPRFCLIRSATRCAWGIHRDVSDDVAEELAALAREEPPSVDLRAGPLHAERYQALCGGKPDFAGPAFTFPDALPRSEGVVLIENERLLQHHFSGWQPGEIAAGRGPVMALLDGGHPVSICFCARRTEAAAAAGLETAAAYRGRGYGPRVTAAWAAAVRATGRVALYGADWTNASSLAVARKLGLIAYASFWSIAD